MSTLREKLVAEIEGSDDYEDVQEALDMMVHDALSSMASDINNKGPMSQVDFLVKDGFSVEQIREVLDL